MTSTTRRVTFPEPHRIHLDEAEIPPIGPGDALIRTTAVGICGSDLHALAGKHRFIPLPCHPGHEVAGVIEAVGADVAGYAAGDRVLVEPGLVCGTCDRCREGRYNICDELKVFGCQTPGAMADRFVIDAGRLHAVPEGMSDTAAALVEPLSTATHAVRAAGGDLTGKRIAVLGAGTIGLLTMLAARAAGADRVVVTDLLGHKRERAVRLGADAALDGAGDVASEIRSLLGGRADVTFDCVTNQASMDQAIALADKGGTIIVEGIPTVNVTVDLLLVQDRELRIEGALMYTIEDVELAIRLMAEGVVPAGEIVTATFRLGEAQAAFDAARSGEHVKVHVVP
jgi:2-desacetyl-2-hydroxyethyl bacteriochlorophyllide A dehydrogenase